VIDPAALEMVLGELTGYAERFVFYRRAA